MLGWPEGSIEGWLEGWPVGTLGMKEGCGVQRVRHGGKVSVKARLWLGSKLGGRVMVMVMAGERSELGSWSELGLVNLEG